MSDKKSGPSVNSKTQSKNQENQEPQTTPETVAAPVEKPTLSHDKTLNIYQRMVIVQKSVGEVQKRELVKMFENDKGYKAVSHDDVAEALHMPLAEAGVFMLPDIVKYETTMFDKKNQYGKEVTWYRTDLEIEVKWINVDKPDEFIKSKGAAFALDTSDKSFAKAYSLALKIVLLKVHLLASRDDEEQRRFEEINGVDQKPQGRQQNNQNQTKGKAGEGPEKSNQGQAGASAHAKNPPQNNHKTTTQKPSPEHYVMPVGSDGVKGKKLGELPTNVLGQILGGAEAALAKTPDNKGWKLIKANVELVIKGRSAKGSPDKSPEGEGSAPPEPDLNDIFPEDEPQTSPPIENESQERQTKKPQPEDYVMPEDFGVDGVGGKALKAIPEKELRQVVKNLDSAMKTTPPPGNVGELFGVRNQIVGFFKSMDLKV